LVFGQIFWLDQNQIVRMACKQQVLAHFWNFVQFFHFFDLFSKMSDTPAYDLSKSEQDLQRYFIYKAIEKDGQTELKGQRRKCNKDCARNNRGTIAMLNYLKKCDKSASDT
jgi:hypothetical protein